MKDVKIVTGMTVIRPLNMNLAWKKKIKKVAYHCYGHIACRQAPKYVFALKMTDGAGEKNAICKNTAIWQ